MIGPFTEGFRTGQRVQVNDPSRIEHGKIGYITAISQEGDRYIFHVDMGKAHKSNRPIVRRFSSAQLIAQK
jgi:hypothetical protein